MTPYASAEAVQRLNTQIVILKLKVLRLEQQHSNVKYRLNTLTSDMGAVKSRLAEIANRALTS